MWSGGKIPCTLVAVMAMATVGTAATTARADDPLDEVDGTEDWDQVAPSRRTRRPPRHQTDRETFRREVADWENVRLLWQQEREKYLHEKSNHSQLTRKLRRSGRSGRKNRPGNHVMDTLYQDEWEDDAHAEIISDPLNMIFGQVAHGGVVANIVRNFSIQPDAVI